MNKLIKEILTNKAARDKAMLVFLMAVLTEAGQPWWGAA